MEMINETELTKAQADKYIDEGIHAKEGETLISVLRRAERHDIREALSECELDSTDYDSNDVRRVHTLIKKGMTAENAIKKVVNDILQAKAWPSLDDDD